MKKKMPKITGDMLLKAVKEPITLIPAKKGHQIVINEKGEYYYIPLS